MQTQPYPASLSGVLAGRKTGLCPVSPELNQTPEQIARDRIDRRLHAAGWHLQNKDALDFNAGLGVAAREYQTAIGPADYVLFADRQAVGVIEAKPDSWGAKLTTVEEQSAGYANAKLTARRGRQHDRRRIGGQSPRPRRPRETVCAAGPACRLNSCHHSG